MKALQDFFDFEIKIGLFDIKDKYGFTVWESIRYFVCNNIVMQWGNIKLRNKNNNIKKIFLTLKKIFGFILYFISHRKADIMFFLCSRDNKDGVLYDKILGKIFELSNKQNYFAIESYTGSTVEKYKYNGKTCTPILVSIIKRTLKRKKLNCEIYNKLTTSFPNISFDLPALQNDYQEFLAQYRFYRFLFNFCGIKKVFIVQNGIQKGLFAAANKCGVKVIELQHGQVSENHPAYSYSKEMVNFPEKIYAPDVFLTFGNFWMKNSVFPGVKIEPLGNDFYSQSGSINSSENVEKKILVISSYIHGEVLSRCVKEISEKDRSFSFYYKLHPNEYADIEKYKTLFVGNDKITIITNEATVTELLSKTEFVLLIQSTAELEALRNGKKVIVLRQLDYEALDFVFNEKGIYFIDEANEFVSCYNAHKDEQIEPRTDIFQPFDSEKALELLKC